jgi:hypothetical protein
LASSSDRAVHEIISDQEERLKEFNAPTKSSSLNTILIKKRDKTMRRAREGRAESTNLLG